MPDKRGVREASADLLTEVTWGGDAMTWGISAGNERGMTETALRPAPGQQKRGAGRDLGGAPKATRGFAAFF